MNNNSKTVVALLAGLAAGAALGILFAPSKGEETQDRLSQSLRDLKDRILDKAKEGVDKLSTAQDALTEKAKDKFSTLKNDAKAEVIKKVEEA
ncbi:YtxH domain-containing protein [Pedobacter aquatilis]|uniref:YtxH domain-containing protein n=1 Tax=Pedobacter aquatilis TaxID=351343 RepID=UPI00292CAA50|nr:YtxH domain-containing protein [Pedobacter aquatilis]